MIISKILAAIGYLASIYGTPVTTDNDESLSSKIQSLYFPIQELIYSQTMLLIVQEEIKNEMIERFGINEALEIYSSVYEGRLFWLSIDPDLNDQYEDELKVLAKFCKFDRKKYPLVLTLERKSNNQLYPKFAEMISKYFVGHRFYHCSIRYTLDGGFGETGGVPNLPYSNVALFTDEDVNYLLNRPDDERFKEVKSIVVSPIDSVSIKAIVSLLKLKKIRNFRWAMHQIDKSDFDPFSERESESDDDSSYDDSHDDSDVEYYFYENFNNVILGSNGMYRADKELELMVDYMKSPENTLETFQLESIVGFNEFISVFASENFKVKHLAISTPWETESHVWIQLTREACRKVQSLSTLLHGVEVAAEFFEIISDPQCTIRELELVQTQMKIFKPVFYETNSKELAKALTRKGNHISRLSVGNRLQIPITFLSKVLKSPENKLEILMINDEYESIIEDQEKLEEFVAALKNPNCKLKYLVLNVPTFNLDMTSLNQLKQEQTRITIKFE